MIKHFDGPLFLFSGIIQIGLSRNTVELLKCFLKMRWLSINVAGHKIYVRRYLVKAIRALRPHSIEFPVLHWMSKKWKFYLILWIIWRLNLVAKNGFRFSFRIQWIFFFALNFIAAILDLITTGKANKLFTVGIKKQIWKLLHDKLDCFVFNGNFLAFDKAV